MLLATQKGLGAFDICWPGYVNEASKLNRLSYSYIISLSSKGSLRNGKLGDVSSISYSNGIYEHFLTVLLHRTGSYRYSTCGCRVASCSLELGCSCFAHSPDIGDIISRSSRAVGESRRGHSDRRTGSFHIDWRDRMRLTNRASSDPLGSECHDWSGVVFPLGM